MNRQDAKSSTDIHWNERARSELSNEKVNIGDTVQRELETDFILSVLPADARILEAGCGNGFLTRILRERCRFVDAFDYAENMVARAREFAGETNNRFFCDNILAPRQVEAPYDAIVCVRVLINLRDLQEQKLALANLAGLLRPGGKLILVEGYSNGFAALDELRTAASLPPLAPARINFYSRAEEIEAALAESFTVASRFHTGMFDFLTRVIYPINVGAGNVQEAGDFHRGILPLARKFNPDDLANLARVRGLELIRR